MAMLDRWLIQRFSEVFKVAEDQLQAIHTARQTRGGVSGIIDNVTAAQTAAGAPITPSSAQIDAIVRRISDQIDRSMSEATIRDFVVRIMRQADSFNAEEIERQVRAILGRSLPCWQPPRRKFRG
jgi:hypothetical protein